MTYRGLMKILILIFLFIGMSQAQWGNNLTTNSEDWNDPTSGLADGWQEVVGAQTSSIVTGNGFSGNAQRWEENNASNHGAINHLAGIGSVGSLDPAATYGVWFWHRSSTTFRIYNWSGTSKGVWSGNTGNAVLRSKTNIVFASDRAYIGLLSSSGYWAEIDSFFLREKLDSLWNDPSVAGDETSRDTTKTIQGGFNRGVFAAGVFITNTGTYAESITIPGDFTKWETSGGCVTITGEVNFADATVTVSGYFDFTGGTANDSNVTYTLTSCDDGQDKGYKNYKGYNKYKR